MPLQLRGIIALKSTARNAIYLPLHRSAYSLNSKCNTSGINLCASRYPVSGLYNATIVCSFFSLFSQGQSSLQFRKISTFPLQLMSDNKNYAAAGLVETAKNEEKPNQHVDQLITLALDESYGPSALSYWMDETKNARFVLNEQFIRRALKDKPQVAHLLVVSWTDSVSKFSAGQMEAILGKKFANFEEAVDKPDELRSTLRDRTLTNEVVTFLIAADNFVSNLKTNIPIVQEIDTFDKLDVFLSKLKQNLSAKTLTVNDPIDTFGHNFPGLFSQEIIDTLYINLVKSAKGHQSRRLPVFFNYNAPGTGKTRALRDWGNWIMAMNSKDCNKPNVLKENLPSDSCAFTIYISFGNGTKLEEAEYTNHLGDRSKLAKVLIVRRLFSRYFNIAFRADDLMSFEKLSKIDPVLVICRVVSLYRLQRNLPLDKKIVVFFSIDEFQMLILKDKGQSDKERRSLLKEVSSALKLWPSYMYASILHQNAEAKLDAVNAVVLGQMFAGTGVEDLNVLVNEDDNSFGPVNLFIPQQLSATDIYLLTAHLFGASVANDEQTQYLLRYSGGWPRLLEMVFQDLLTGRKNSRDSIDIDFIIKDAERIANRSAPLENETHFQIRPNDVRAAFNFAISDFISRLLRIKNDEISSIVEKILALCISRVHVNLGNSDLKPVISANLAIFQPSYSESVTGTMMLPMAILHAYSLFLLRNGVSNPFVIAINDFASLANLHYDASTSPPIWEKLVTQFINLKIWSLLRVKKRVVRLSDIFPCDKFHNIYVDLSDWSEENGTCQLQRQYPNYENVELTNGRMYLNAPLAPFADSFCIFPQMKHESDGSYTPMQPILVALQFKFATKEEKHFEWSVDYEKDCDKVDDKMHIVRVKGFPGHSPTAYTVLITNKTLPLTKSHSDERPNTCIISKELLSKFFGPSMEVIPFLSHTPM